MSTETYLVDPAFKMIEMVPVLVMIVVVAIMIVVVANLINLIMRAFRGSYDYKDEEDEASERITSKIIQNLNEGLPSPNDNVSSKPLIIHDEAYFNRRL